MLPVRGMRGFPLNILGNNEAPELLKNIVRKTVYTGSIADIDESTSNSSHVGHMTWISSLLLTPVDIWHLTSYLTCLSFSLRVAQWCSGVVCLTSFWWRWLRNLKEVPQGMVFQVVGVDLTVTNPRQVSKAMIRNHCHCHLLTVNQISNWIILGLLFGSVDSNGFPVFHWYWDIVVNMDKMRGFLFQS